MATARMPQPTADDPVKVDPKHYKVEFENERVRVQRIRYGAGEKSVMHSHPESIAVFLTDAHGKFTYPDGKTEDINAKAGTVQHMDAHTHLPEKPQQEAIRSHCSGVEALSRFMMATQERERISSRSLTSELFRIFTRQSTTTPKMMVRIASALALE